MNVARYQTPLVASGDLVITRIKADEILVVVPKRPNQLPVWYKVKEDRHERSYIMRKGHKHYVSEMQVVLKKDA